MKKSRYLPIVNNHLVKSFKNKQYIGTIVAMCLTYSSVSDRVNRHPHDLHNITFFKRSKKSKISNFFRTNFKK